MPDKRKNNPGRPKETEHMNRVNITLWAAQHAKLKQLGGSAWVRKQIDKARIKPDSSSV